eukprot:TRINITY_DN2651_c0_g1_i1.p2 TRINITY_DN2651_c0_g1~~TRINITY_DN2651_c0_g1_i1.p2  ORF type:complete len:243 (+),score=74.21 TRINITY_DN2651_c0_g1_i1:118-846(+)
MSVNNEEKRERGSVQYLASQFTGENSTPPAKSPRPNSFIKANPTSDNSNNNNNPSPLSKRTSVIDVQSTQETNSNVPFPFNTREPLLPSIKQSFLDKTVDKITNFSLSYLVDGIKVKNGTTKEEILIRITDDLKYFECVPTSSTNNSPSERVSVSNIAEVIEEGNQKIKMEIKGQVMPIILEFGEKYPHIFALDALKSLIGFPLQSNEMRELLNVLTEVKALSSLYSHPKRPSHSPLDASKT